MFGSFGWMELLLILFIVLIIFGAGKLPQLGEGVGKAIKGFKRSVHEPEPPTEEELISQWDTVQPTQSGPDSAGIQTPSQAPRAESPPADPERSTPRQA